MKLLQELVHVEVQTHGAVDGIHTYFTFTCRAVKQMQVGCLIVH